MRKLYVVLFLLLIISRSALHSQQKSDTSIYLITCGPGTQTYSVYGHSALRIAIASAKTDNVYNWGVFDFETPNFAWKFAKGRLDYLLDVTPLNRFLGEYFYEKRYVISQKLNTSPAETRKIMDLINENLKPENLKYRYDFFYDDCSTRIRDIIETATGKAMLYPPADKKEGESFRRLVGRYQEPYPWLKFGVDLIMGSPGDKKAYFREKMFLPDGLKNGLSETVLNHDSKMVPLLQNPQTILDFPPPSPKKQLLLSPSFVFTYLLVLIVILSAAFKKQRINKVIDIIIYSAFSVLALLMIFFNFFTDHHQMSWNLNIIWLSPVIPVCLALVIGGSKSLLWFRILFVLTAFFLVFQFVLPQGFNTAFVPLATILLVRSSVRSGFDWNPLSLG